MMATGSRWGSARSLAFDVALAAAAMALSFGITVSLSRDMTPAVRTAVFVLLGLHTGVLAARRRAPWTVFTINLVTGLSVVAIGLPQVVLQLAPLVALYSVASRVERSRSALALAASICGLIAAAGMRGFEEDLATAVGNVVGLAAVWIIGTLVYARQVYVKQLETRTRELEEAREELAEKVATEERLRIARELHDIVAHSLSVIAVQSGVGAHVIEQNPQEARRALATIEDSSRRALHEMRGLLSVLRNGNAAGTAPLPGLRDIDDLAARISGAGTEVDVRLLGDVGALPPAVDLTAYRIVQESLTNVVKHARARSARVVIARADDQLTVDVVDDGVGSAGSADREGHGLQGMRERAEALGGNFEAGPLPEGGFRVHARVPLERSA